MQFFKFVILSITRILDELSFVLVDVILGYRHQVCIGVMNLRWTITSVTRKKSASDSPL